MDSPVSCHYAVTCVLKKIRTKRVCIPTTSSCIEMIGSFRYQPNNSFHAAGLFLHPLKFKKKQRFSDAFCDMKLVNLSFNANINRH